MIILIDNGHGQNTSGKRSPDGRFLEYKFNREIARRIVLELCDRNLDARLLVPEDEDIPLTERCKRANTISHLHGKNNVIIISIHVNAYGNGEEWTKPHGWSVFTSKNQTQADILADHLAEAAKKHLTTIKLRGDFSDGDIDYEESFYLLRHTISPAVLTENGFMTNQTDLEYLESRAGKQALTDLHIQGILEYVNQ